MQKTKLVVKKNKILRIISIISVSIFVIVLIKSTIYSPNSEITPPLSSVTNIVKNDSSVYPKKLIIPSIDINADIKKVGITKDGNMATPSNFTDVGWYKYGTLPGDKGSAVIAGHVDNGLAFPGVFSKLKDLKKGDDVYVQAENGKSLHFIVTKVDFYNFDESPSEVFNQSDGKFIKLITCTGTWNEKYKTHNKRLVVTALLAK